MLCHVFWSQVEYKIVCFIPRIQHLLLRLQKYDIDLIFSPGNSIPVPDVLSRAYLSNTEEDDNLSHLNIKFIF